MLKKLGVVIIIGVMITACGTIVSSNGPKGNQVPQNDTIQREMSQMNEPKMRFASAKGGLNLTEEDWFTFTGIVSTTQATILMVESSEYGQVALPLGRLGYASSQNVTFTVGDMVTILGFYGPNSFIQAGQITNDTTGATLYLRNTNGRPLWAGQGKSRQVGMRQDQQGLGRQYQQNMIQGQPGMGKQHQQGMRQGQRGMDRLGQSEIVYPTTLITGTAASPKIVSLYINYCSACHGIQGEGSLIAPAFSQSSKTSAELSQVISKGIPGTAMVGWTINFLM